MRALPRECQHFRCAALVPDNRIRGYPDEKAMFHYAWNLIQLQPECFGIRDFPQMAIEKVMAAVRDKRGIQAAAHRDLRIP